MDDDDISLAVKVVCPLKLLIKSNRINNKYPTNQKGGFFFRVVHFGIDLHLSDGPLRSLTK